MRLRAFRITLAHQLAMLNAGLNPGDEARKLREFHFRGDDLLGVTHDEISGELEVERISVEDMLLHMMTLGQPHVSEKPQ